MIRHLDLFSGIGGNTLAAEEVWGDEHETLSFCDFAEFPQAVLRARWPSVPVHGDIRTLKGDAFGPIDLVTGGFPCQPFSAAGKRRGKEDDRDLWPEMFRVIREAQPRWIIGENVAGFINMELERTATDLESEGYEVWPFVIPACGVNAPHKRDRIWVVAHNVSNPGIIGRQGREAERESGENPSRTKQLPGFLQFDTESALSDAGVYRASHGVSHRMDGHRSTALGNSIVPQVAVEIMRGMKMVDENDIPLKKSLPSLPYSPFLVIERPKGRRHTGWSL